jgi:hypothetical protein
VKVDKENMFKGYDPSKPKFRIGDDLKAKLSPDTICHRLRLIYLQAARDKDSELMRLIAECYDMAKRMNHRLIYYRARYDAEGEAPDDFPYKW